MESMTVNIQAETSAVRGHLVVKHDLLAEAPVEAEQERVTGATGYTIFTQQTIKYKCNIVPRTVPPTKAPPF